MNRSTTGEDWSIYNCHIHTFTRQHTPKYFIKFVLSDADLGRINWAKVPFYLLYVVLYFLVLVFLAKLSLLLSIRSDIPSLLAYSILLLVQALLLVPLVLFVFILAALVVIWLLQGLINLLIKMRSVSQSSQTDQQLTQWKEAVDRGQSRVMRSSLLTELLVRINPASNDIFERTARFLKISAQPSQQAVFDKIENQYPRERTVFIVLPMDMGFMKLGRLGAPIEDQHAELWRLAQKSNGQIIPFYAADPRHPDIVERVKNNLARDKFRGIKIYPSLGYKPDDARLMEVYEICIAGDFPVLTHCSPGGIWQYGLSKQERRANSNPKSYLPVLEKYPTLKLCLAHFGGAEEWIKHLKGRVREDEDHEEAWVRTVYSMIASGNYPNLYTDISYTVFTPKVQGLYIDLLDYLKVLLSNPLVRKRVLFGSDYYMVERENISEKEASILLRSRLGEDLYKQIAYTNPREFLGIETQEPKTVTKKKPIRR